MKAFVLTGPSRSEIQDVPDPRAGAGQAVVDVARVGICGTDAEFFTGQMEYLRQGHARYPMVLGHEWCGTVSAVGQGVDQSWLGRRVTGDTMLGCGRCARCRSGRHHVCEDRSEIGVRGAFPGALAEKLIVPATALHPLPDTVDDTAGAMVEPGGNSLRSFDAAGVQPGERLLVIGPGTIGLLVAQFAVAHSVNVHLAGRPGRSLDFARELGIGSASTLEDLPDLPFDAVVDASNADMAPSRAIALVEPGRRVVFVGLAGPEPGGLRDIAPKDVTAVGISVIGGLGGHDPAWFARSIRDLSSRRSWSAPDARHTHRWPRGRACSQIQVDPGSALNRRRMNDLDGTVAGDSARCRQGHTGWRGARPGW
jgi:threonine dehydrogenase-like Zn-dependent dehydrogenase